MNKEVNLSITTLKVEIKVLVLDGKRFTKSVFDQLQEFSLRKWAEWQFELGGSVAIGFCDISKERWVLFTESGILYKAPLAKMKKQYPVFEHEFRNEESMNIEPPRPIGLPVSSMETFEKTNSGILWTTAYEEQLISSYKGEELIEKMRMFNDYVFKLERWKSLRKDYLNVERSLERKRNDMIDALPISPKDQIFISI